MSALQESNPRLVEFNGMTEHEKTNQKHNELLRELNPFVETQLNLLLSPEEAWQPSDYLPDPHSDEFTDEIKKIQEQAKNIPDKLMEVFIGNLITEEGLPNFTTLQEKHPGVMDKTGTEMTPWAKWRRGWTAEENRHGVVFDRYAWLSGRCDMNAVEKTIHKYIAVGFNPQVGEDPYNGLVFTSWQEPATQIAHARVGDQADKFGDPSLAKISRQAGKDEARHARFYQNIMGEIFKRDPEGAVLAFWNMVKTRIAMPGASMEGFSDFANSAQELGIYTSKDYTYIYKRLMREWKVENLSVDGEAGKAQEKLVKKLQQYERFSEMEMPKIEPHTSEWIYNPKSDTFISLPPVNS